MKLIEAIKANDQEEFSRLLNLKINHFGKRFIDEVDPEYGASPLSWAAALGYVNFINHLLQAGANVNKQDKNGKTPVYEAAEGGHSSVITVLHAAGANVNKPNRDGETPVYIAAKNGHALAIAALHVVGANVDTPNKNGKTPIYAASQENHIEAVAALKAAGANMNILMKGGIKILNIGNTSKTEKINAVNHSVGFSKLFLGSLTEEKPDVKKLRESEYQSLIENENISKALTKVDVATKNAIKIWGTNLAKPLEVLTSCYYIALKKSDSSLVKEEKELTEGETELLKIVESFNIEILHTTQDISEEERALLSLAGIEEELNPVVPLEPPAPPEIREQNFNSLTAFELQRRSLQEKPTTHKVVVALELEDDQNVTRRNLNNDAIRRSRALGRNRDQVVL